MSDKLKVLTDKIYEEGIEKAQRESQKILDDSKKEAQKIISAAEKQSQDLILKTEVNMENLKKKVASEIKMASRKSLNQIKQELNNVIQEKVVSNSINKEFARVKKQHNTELRKIRNIFIVACKR